MAKDKVGKASGRASAKATSAQRSGGKLASKPYERELARLHAELVKLQLWAVHKGLKVCVVFEGRDGAGKGGVIKAITERVSPRVFRVVALPAPTEREKSQMYATLYPASAGGGRDRDLRPQLVQPRGGRAHHGLLLARGGAAFPPGDAGSREGVHRIRHHPAQILARGQPRGAAAPAGGAHQRRPEDLETLADGHQVLSALVRLFARSRRHVRGDGYALGALVCGAFRRQEARAPERDLAHAEQDPLWGAAARKR